MGFPKSQPWIAALSLCCAAVCHALALADGSPAQAKNTNLGVALSPAHIPFQTGADIDQFFQEARRIGSHVTWIIEWQSMPPITEIRAIREQTRRYGLGFHLYLSPIALTGRRRTPAIPSVVGESSFRAQVAREAFKRQALELAALRPDVLGLATEINFLASNPDEFGAFVSLAREVYSAVKRKNPAQAVTVSFQWDVMAAHAQFGLLAKFANVLDVYSFTTYPDAFGPDPALPGAEYYSAIRRILPTQRVGFAEIGWSSAFPSSADQQARFYGSIPRLFGALKADYLTLALMHDVPIFAGDLARLNFVGIRTLDDQPKPAWNAVLNLPELH